MADAGLKTIQAQLNALGYSPALVVDGVLGDKTRAAVAWARSRLGLGPGGVDARLAAALAAAAGASPSPSTSSIPGLQAAVVAALPSIFGKWEGSGIPWMYLDEKGYVTTGTGNLIDPATSALSLGWVNPDGSPSSQAQIQAAWNAVDALRTGPKGQKQPSGAALQGGGAAVFKNATSIRLPPAALAKLVLHTVAQNNAYFVSKYPGFSSWPADAQLAMHSLGWAWGPGFAAVWGALGQAFNAAAAKKDFASMAAIMKQASEHEESINPGIVPRDLGTEQMFANAAHVLDTAGDIAQLFYPASAGALMGIRLLKGAKIDWVDAGFVAGGAVVGALFMGPVGILFGGLTGAAIDVFRRVVK